MRLVRLGKVALCLALVAPLAAEAQVSVPECVEVEAFVRWGAEAYNHFVRVRNGCERPVRCQVASDVNPVAQEVDVPAGQAVEVLTFRGSPAREHTARVSCVTR